MPKPLFKHLLLSIVLVSSQASVTAASLASKVVDGAKSQVGVTIRYDPAYVRLSYPGGDVPLDRGVCTDVVIRAYRAAGIDLQELVHEDMRAAWPAYTKVAMWGLKRPDANIDHRRVPNLSTFFRLHGAELKASRDLAAYQPGDIVTWRLPNGLLHIGLVADSKSPTGVPLIVHNIGAGTQVEDLLFTFTITGHFRYPRPAGS